LKRRFGLGNFLGFFFNFRIFFFGRRCLGGFLDLRSLLLDSSIFGFELFLRLFLDNGGFFFGFRLRLGDLLGSFFVFNLMLLGSFSIDDGNGTLLFAVGILNVNNEVRG
jgi:hypothetical protein